MATTIGVLAVLGFVSALGLVWERLHKRPHRPLARSDVDRARARQTLDYHAKVWDSTSA